MASTLPPRGGGSSATSSSRPPRDLNALRGSSDHSPRGGTRGRGGGTSGTGSIPPLSIPDGTTTAPHRGNSRRGGRGGSGRGSGPFGRGSSRSDANNVTSPTGPSLKVPSPSDTRHRSPRPARTSPSTSPSTPQSPLANGEPGPPAERRRKRSKQQGKGSRGGAPALTTKPVRDLLSRLSDPPEASTSTDVPPSPDPESISKRHDLDLLVQHVHERARVSTPSDPNHLDWADDDDESLPDISDFITHSQMTASKAGSISTDVASPLTPKSAKSDVPERISVPTPKISNVAEVKEDIPLAKSANTPGNPILEAPKKSPESTVSSAVLALQTPTHDAKVQEEPSHPSTDIPSITLTNDSSAQDTFPSSPPTPSPASHSAPPSPSSTAQKFESLLAAMNLEPAPQTNAAELEEEVEPEGLEASYWAPANRPKESHTHQRAHTAHSSPSKDMFTDQSYRPNGVHTPQRANISGRRGLSPSPGHSRNHSSPPGMSPRPKSATRPVLTGDAISRLARSIGGRPPRAAAVAVSVAEP